MQDTTLATVAVQSITTDTNKKSISLVQKGDNAEIKILGQEVCAIDVGQSVTSTEFQKKQSTSPSP